MDTQRKIEIMNKILTSVKGHNSITNARKIMCNNLSLDLVDINAHMQNLVIFFSNCSEDIEGN